jgi:phosphoserine phosphatase
MKIAIFLDVDKTLTKDYIQSYYAEELDCKPDYEKLEDDLKHGRINVTVFGHRIIALFASKGLTKSRAKEISTCVELRDWAKELLRKKIDIYLVSSGPSYYIDEMIGDYEIPKQRVLRSHYTFAENGIISGCEAVSPQRKQNFVMDNLSRYDVSIGVGDDANADGPFVGACTIPLLLEPYAGFLHVDNFSSISLLVDKLMKVSESVDSLTVDKLKGMTISQSRKAFSLGVWALFWGILLGSFAIGAAAARYFPKLFQ